MSFRRRAERFRQEQAGVAQTAAVDAVTDAE
jgi:hypothetical protein